MKLEKFEDVIQQPPVLSNEEYSGPLNFEVFIDPHNSGKNPWMVNYTNLFIFSLILSLEKTVIILVF